MVKQSRRSCSGFKEAQRSESEKDQTPFCESFSHPQAKCQLAALVLCYICRFDMKLYISRYGVDVHDFGKSWRSGLAFLAMIKSINPDLVDLRESWSKQPKENIREAFMIAHHSLDVPPLLEPDGKTLLDDVGA